MIEAMYETRLQCMERRVAVILAAMLFPAHQGALADPSAAGSVPDWRAATSLGQGPGPRFGVLVHHTDAEREWAYDRASPVGRLTRGLDEAGKRGWTVVDIKRDWKRVFPAR